MKISEQFGYQMPEKLKRVGLPKSLDEFSALIMDIEEQMALASDEHLRYSLAKARFIGEYQKEWDRLYDASAGLDPHIPVSDQRESGKRGAGTVAEHEAYARQNMADGFAYEMMQVDTLIRAWAARIEALQSQLSAVQSAANNERAQIGFQK